MTGLQIFSLNFILLSVCNLNTQNLNFNVFLELHQLFYRKWSCHTNIIIWILCVLTSNNIKSYMIKATIMLFPRPSDVNKYKNSYINHNPIWMNEVL